MVVPLLIGDGVEQVADRPHPIAGSEDLLWLQWRIGTGTIAETRFGGLRFKHSPRFGTQY